MSNSSSSSPASSSAQQDKCLLAIVFDVTPSAWGERELKRNASDRARLAAGKRSVGPGRFESDMLPAILAFSLAFSSLHRENCLVVVAVSGDETAVVYPRKGGGPGPAGSGSMSAMVNDPPEMCGSKIDSRRMHDSVRLGVAELVVRAAARADRASKMAAEAAERAAASGGDGAGASDGTTPTGSATSASPLVDGAAITAGVSLALCCINRFSVSALRGGGAVSSAEALLKRREDEGVLAMIEGRNKGGGGGGPSGRGGDDGEMERLRRARGMLSPRILVVQATPDRTRDYNAFMNCAFAAVKEGIVIDGCFVPSGGGRRDAKTSAFLEQACDRTGGVFLAPSGAAQIDGALLEVMVSVFLAPAGPARRRLNLPALGKVDFRARCFETGESVDVAHVCNQCLSIFKDRPRGTCPTCGAEAVTATAASSSASAGPVAKRSRFE